MALVLTREKHQGIYFDSKANDISVSDSVHVQFSGMLKDDAGWKCKIHAFGSVKISFVDETGTPQSHIMEAEEQRLLKVVGVLHINFVEVSKDETVDVSFERIRSKNQFRAIICGPLSIRAVREELEARAA